MERFIYSAKVTKQGNDHAYTLQFVDIPEAITQGDNMKELMLMAREVLELCLMSRYVDNEEIPVPTNPEDIELEPHYFVLPIEVNLTLVKDKSINQSVKKTVTLPFWLRAIAEENNVNFSQLLQVAIKEHLNITR